MILGQTKVEPETGTVLVNLILAMIPWLLLISIIWFVLIRFAKKERQRTSDYFARNMRHMDSVESKLDRLIELQERDR